MFFLVRWGKLAIAFHDLEAESIVAASVLYQCGCAAYRSRQPHSDQLLHRQINLPMSRLDEQQRRWFAAFAVIHQWHGRV